MTQKNLLFRRRIITLFVVLALFAPIIVNINTVMAKDSNTTESNLGIEEAPKMGEELSINADEVNVTDYSGFDDNYGTISDIFISGNYMYIALGSEGLAIYNITNLEPKFITQWDNYSCNRVYADNNLLYLSNNTGIYVLDAANYNNLALLTNLSTGTVYDIYAENEFVFITTTLGFYSVNITDYLNPAIIDAYSNTQLREFHVSNGIAYVKDSDRVRIFNITEADNLNFLTDVFIGGLNDIYYLDDTLYCADSDDAFLYNVTDPASPVYFTNYEFNNTGSNQIVVIGDYLYIEEFRGIVVVDISNKSQPLYFTEFRETITMGIINAYGNYLFCNDDYQIEIIDANTPSDLVSLWIDQIYGSTQDLFVDGTKLYAADVSSLEIIDISDPENPEEIGKYKDEDALISHVYVHNDYAYIYENGFGMKIIDVSDPTNLIELGNISFAGSFADIYVSDEYAYIAQGGDGLLVIDIYYPDYPQKSLQYEEYDAVYALEKMGDYLYIASGEYFHILDMSNPYKPTEIGNWTRLNANYYDIFLDENYAYLLCDEGFDIIDISDPIEPVKIGQFFNYQIPWKIFVDGQYIYLLDFALGLDVFDASTIAHPKPVASYEPSTFYYDVFARNGYIYLAGSLDGVVILITEPLLTVKSGIGPFTFVCGLVFFSVLGLLIRKKKKN